MFLYDNSCNYLYFRRRHITFCIYLLAVQENSFIVRSITYGYAKKNYFTITSQQDSWIKSQIKSGKYGNDSEYLRELIRLDQAHKNKIAILRAALIEGEKSGVSQRSMTNILEDAKKGTK